MADIDWSSPKQSQEIDWSTPKENAPAPTTEDSLLDKNKKVAKQTAAGAAHGFNQAAGDLGNVLTSLLPDVPAYRKQRQIFEQKQQALRDYGENSTSFNVGNVAGQTIANMPAMEGNAVRVIAQNAIAGGIHGYGQKNDTGDILPGAAIQGAFAALGPVASWASNKFTNRFFKNLAEETGYTVEEAKKNFRLSQSNPGEEYAGLSDIFKGEFTNAVKKAWQATKEAMPGAVTGAVISGAGAGATGQPVLPAMGYGALAGASVGKKEALGAMARGGLNAAGAANAMRPNLIPNTARAVGASMGQVMNNPTMEDRDAAALKMLLGQ